MRGAILGAWRTWLNFPRGLRGIEYLDPSGPVAMTVPSSSMDDDLIAAAVDRSRIVMD